MKRIKYIPRIGIHLSAILAIPGLGERDVAKSPAMSRSICKHSAWIVALHRPGCKDKSLYSVLDRFRGLLRCVGGNCCFPALLESAGNSQPCMQDSKL